MIRNAVILTCTFLITTAVGCGSSEEQPVNGGGLSQLIDLTTEAVQSTDGAASLVGAKKQEYRILQFDDADSPEKVEETLNVLGSEGWDCNSVSPGAHSLRLMCRRHTNALGRRIAELGEQLISAIKDSPAKEKHSGRF